MSVHRCLVLLALLLVASPTLARAQLSEESQISLITIMPGDAIWSLYGHSALRVYDPAQNFDASYNYGTFTFGNPLVFAATFSYGKLDYFLSVASYPRIVDHYWEIEQRPVIEQVLNLDRAQRNALFSFLENNARPENQYYLYDFFFDNCSTRIRDAFEDVLGSAVSFTATPDPAQTFRSLLDPYEVEKPVLDFGMDLGLGLPADRIATAREAVFLPLYLKDAFDYATINIDGNTLPLVARTDTVTWSDELVTLDAAWPWPLILMWGLLALGLGVILRDWKTGRTERRLFDGLLFGITGIAGVVIVFLWFISLHTVTHVNLNLLWAWPTHLIVAGILIRRKRPSWLRGYLLATGGIALIFTVASFLLPQEIPAPVLPLLLLLAARCGALIYTPPSQTAPATTA